MDVLNAKDTIFCYITSPPTHQPLRPPKEALKHCFASQNVSAEMQILHVPHHKIGSMDNAPLDMQSMLLYRPKTVEAAHGKSRSRIEMLLRIPRWQNDALKNLITHNCQFCGQVWDPIQPAWRPDQRCWAPFPQALASSGLRSWVGGHRGRVPVPRPNPPHHPYHCKGRGLDLQLAHPSHLGSVLMRVPEQVGPKCPAGACCSWPVWRADPKCPDLSDSKCPAGDSARGHVACLPGAAPKCPEHTHQVDPSCCLSCAAAADFHSSSAPSDARCWLALPCQDR